MLEYIATCAYALESVTARELQALGAQGVQAQTTRVRFCGDEALGARANVWLRSAGRVRLVVGTFAATTFDALFEGVRDIPWEDYITRDMAFPISARAVNSTLMSLKDIQAISKKAVAQRLQRVYRESWLPETGAPCAIEVHIHKDTVTVSLDMSGDGLHMRGYRKLNGPAALRETLAASLVLLTKWQGDRPLADPFCGTGTILIEAGMYAMHRAPGMQRTFAAEKWPTFGAALFNDARKEAHAAVKRDPIELLGSDIDEQSLSMAQYHARRAGVPVTFRKADVRKFAPTAPRGHIITNPPYGARMGDREQMQALYRTMGETFAKYPGWAVHVITAWEGFQRDYGAPATKKRALRNGNIPCWYFEYFGKAPRDGQ